jgi:hypothetical protein
MQHTFDSVAQLLQTVARESAIVDDHDQIVTLGNPPEMTLRVGRVLG